MWLWVLSMECPLPEGASESPSSLVLTATHLAGVLQHEKVPAGLSSVFIPSRKRWKQGLPFSPCSPGSELYLVPLSSAPGNFQPRSMG